MTNLSLVPVPDGLSHHPPDRRVGAGVAAVRVADVSKAYGDSRAAVLALDHVDLTVERGEFVCLLGASGCGKSVSTLG